MEIIFPSKHESVSGLRLPPQVPVGYFRGSEVVEVGVAESFEKQKDLERL
jgi:hypothetical protein